MTLPLAEILSTSERVSATRSRRQKVALLAECLRRLPPPLIAVGAAYLAGNLPQGCIGVGYAQLQQLCARDRRRATVPRAIVERRASPGRARGPDGGSDRKGAGSAGLRRARAIMIAGYPATGSFVMLGKTFKGMTDEMLQW